MTRDVSSVSYDLIQLKPTTNWTTLNKLERSEFLTKGGVFINKVRVKSKKGISIFAGDTIEVGESKLMLTR